MIDLMLANAAAGDPASIRALTLLRVLGFDEERLRNTFQHIAEPQAERESKVEKEQTLSEIFDMCVAGSKQRKRDYWLQKHQ
jgi:hypothetical protein